jgi:acyl-coenzyme A synthetase/AMP-(fatty) acid ligase
LLLSHDKIADAAVIGVESPSQGTELPRAYIVPSSSLNSREKETLPSEIVEWVAEHVANHKRLRGGVVLLDAIPKTASGKILRKDLRAAAHKEITAKL